MTGERRMLLFLGVSAAMLMGLIPATAGATDYCVAPKTDCGGTPVPTVEQALDFADDATDADRVFLGATTYTAQTVTGFYYSESSSPVEIIGQGRGQTILTAPSASSFVMRLIGAPGTSVHDLTIQLPQTAAAGLKGLSTANLGRRIEIVEDQMQANKHYGVELVNGGTLEGGRCVRPSPRLLRAKRCVRYRSVGTLKRSGASGPNRIRFTGRIGSRALRPGRYRALITATDTVGNSSTSKPTSFRIAG